MLAGSHPLSFLESPVFFSNPFFQVFQISIGQQDLKPRTGSWRVLQILATINLAVWVGVAILVWLGVGPGNGYWSPL